MTDEELRMAVECQLLCSGNREGLYADALKKFADLIRADERKRFYGQDKPDYCSGGCPPKSICDYCQIVEPVKKMIADEREANAKVCDAMEEKAEGTECCKWPTPIDCAHAIRARGNT